MVEDRGQKRLLKSVFVRVSVCVSPCKIAMKSCQNTIKTINFVFIRVHSWLQMTKVEYTSCPIAMLFLQNEPNFSPFSAQKPRFTEKTNPKRTQTNPNEPKLG